MPHIIRCRNGRPHTHETSSQVAACYGVGRAQFSRARAMTESTPVVTARIPDPPMDEQIRKMLLATPDGRYAVRPDDSRAWTFIRLSRPKVGKHKGRLKIQLQVSDSYSPIASLSTVDDYVVVYDKRYLLHLELIVVDPTTGAYEYGRQMKECSRCRKQLTDDRSLYYCIGPECEKYFPGVIAMVNSKHGVYVPRKR